VTHVSVAHVSVAIIGAGFAGIGAAIELRRAGEESFLLLERGSQVGGTWRDNTYPGVACDVPSHLYTFSFRPNLVGRDCSRPVGRFVTTSNSPSTRKACDLTCGWAPR